MDRQNEGIRDLEVRVIPYDVEGQIAVRSWRRKLNHSRIRGLVLCILNIRKSMIYGQVDGIDLENISMKK